MTACPQHKATTSINLDNDSLTQHLHACVSAQHALMLKSIIICIAEPQVIVKDQSTSKIEGNAMDDLCKPFISAGYDTGCCATPEALGKWPLIWQMLFHTHG